MDTAVVRKSTSLFEGKAERFSRVQFPRVERIIIGSDGMSGSIIIGPFDCRSGLDRQRIWAEREIGDRYLCPGRR